MTDSGTLIRCESGQMNIDFIIGLGIFLLALMYVLYAVPGIFLPYQATSVDLSSVVYRTSAILVEDPGWYSNGDPDNPKNGTNWENPQNLQYLSRIGLADSKETPNVLSIDKIKALNDTYQADPSKTLSRLGLNNTLRYHYNLTITRHNESSTETILKIGNNSDVTGVDCIESIDRIVKIDEGDKYFVCGDEPAGTDPVSLKLDVDSKKNYPHDVVVHICHASGVIFYPQRYPSGLPAPYLVPISDYVVYRNGVLLDDPVSDYPTHFTDDDELDIVVFNSTVHNYKLKQVIFMGSFSPAGLMPEANQTYGDVDNPHYRKSYSNGTVSLKVWI